MDWKVYAEYMQKRWSEATLAERFRMATYLYEGLPYEGGKENPLISADCSGTVCGPLYLMGYNIRVNANDLFNMLFTINVSDNETGDQTKIMAVFYKTLKRIKHFGRMVPSGYVVHVAPVVGHWCVLDARKKLEIWTAANARQLNEKLDRDYSLV